MFRPLVGSSAGVSGLHPRMESETSRALHPRADDIRARDAYASVVSNAAFDAVTPDVSTRSALAQARERQEAAARLLRPLALAVAVVMIVGAARAHPAPGFGGSGLAVTSALVVLALATVELMRASESRPAQVLALSALILASGVLVWTQPNGTGPAGLFLAVSVGAMRLPTRISLGALALAAVALAVASTHAWRASGSSVGVEIGLVAFYLIALFANRAREAQQQAERLLAELEASRHVQAEAGALRERGRLAREMHDVLAHSLSGLMLQLEGARMLAASGRAGEELPAALERAHHLARAGLEEARRAIGALRDDELPGADRLEQLAADFERDSHIAAKLEVSGAPRPLPSETSLTIYRVAQEALTNCAKHARPKCVELRLQYEPRGTRLVVEDHASIAARAHLRDGAYGGMNGDGYGLTGMRERAELAGGHFDAAPTLDGFRVELWLPT